MEQMDFGSGVLVAFFGFKIIWEHWFKQYLMSFIYIQMFNN